MVMCAGIATILTNGARIAKPIVWKVIIATYFYVTLAAQGR